MSPVLSTSSIVDVRFLGDSCDEQHIHSASHTIRTILESTACASRTSDSCKSERIKVEVVLRLFIAEGPSRQLCRPWTTITHATGLLILTFRFNTHPSAYRCPCFQDHSDPVTIPLVEGGGRVSLSRLCRDIHQGLACSSFVAVFNAAGMCRISSLNRDHRPMTPCMMFSMVFQASVLTVENLAAVGSFARIEPPFVA